MATVFTPQCSNQSASRCRSAVKVPKLRTGSGSRSGPTAATCKVAPMSTAAAWGWTGGIARFRLDRLPWLIEPSSAAQEAEGMGCATDQFPNRDRPRGRHHSQVRSSPRARFENGVLDHQKGDGRAPPVPPYARPFLPPQAARRAALVWKGRRGRVEGDRTG